MTQYTQEQLTQTANNLEHLHNYLVGMDHSQIDLKWFLMSNSQRVLMLWDECPITTKCLLGHAPDCPQLPDLIRPNIAQLAYINYSRTTFPALHSEDGTGNNLWESLFEYNSTEDSTSEQINSRIALMVTVAGDLRGKLTNNLK